MLYLFLDANGRRSHEWEDQMPDTKPVEMQTVKRDMVTTGVHSMHDCEWLWEDDGIDLGYEAHIEQEHADGSDCDCCMDQQGETLYGAWIKDKDGLYDVDPNGEFSAIYNPDFSTVQVIRSNYAVSCRKCSPCFPCQGDVDSVGNDYHAYILPLDILSDEWKAENKARIMRVED